MEELLLRVGILIGSELKEVGLTEAIVGDFSVNFETFEVVNRLTNMSQNLSKKEVALIQLFVEKKGAVISRTEILDKVWGKDQFPTTRTIDNYILNFRKIFEKDPRHPKYFHSIRGVGYKFTN